MTNVSAKCKTTRSRAFCFAFASLVILVFCCPGAVESAPSPKIDPHQLREHLLKNLGAFADSAATFVVCATDAKVPTNEALAWSAHQSALSEIVETISTHFGDKGLQSAFEMSTFTSAGNSDFKVDARIQTGGCSRASLRRAGDFVSDARNIQKRYLSLPKDALGTSQLTDKSGGPASR